MPYVIEDIDYKDMYQAYLGHLLAINYCGADYKEQIDHILQF